MLRAIIFDFDGIIVDSEPVILKIFQAMARQQGWTLSADEYYRKYLALDDRGIVEAMFHDHGLELPPAERDRLVEWKVRRYMEEIQHGLPPLPGALQFVKQAAARFPIAIASGSLRVEIEHLLATLDLKLFFSVLVTADDCLASKPDPEVYVKAVDRLGGAPAFRERPLQAGECLAIEDAPGGIIAAHRAGIKCLALTHSRPSDEVAHANWVKDNFSDIQLEELAGAFA